MIMADVFTTLFVILGFWLLFPACCLMARSVVPGRVEAAHDYVSAHPFRALGWGLVVWAPTGLGIAVLAKGPGPFKLAAGISAVALMAFTFVGLAGLATRLGRGIESPSDAARPWLATLRGMACLQVPATLPILGWFVVTPTVFLLSAGAALKARAAAPAASPEAAATDAAAPATEGAPA